ncbi:PREDICTED: Bardet-Biedl syndrome 7 protein homolog [Nicrophorus vespilloides]|uniref:Bardet-Biedl syndrome 7 protein homolog n=1 Tax=Nicrophorus vespilloides TaxID=110193 RepID=A0ABM1MN27_NICVS|nr:PREDICTED: Bardet-Biedl syndrome 7 protein homolog [Nicrophorus vespilloides]
MELELTRVDYTIIGVNSNNCMKLVPIDNNREQQKIAVADNDGVLQVFSIRKEDVSLHFKTLPGPKCTSLQLAGAQGTLSDKIFIASENEVRGYTKKGKLFLSFDTNLTEPISSMYVLGSDLFICGKHIYNQYRDCKDIGSYLCGDRIVDVIALYPEKSYRLISLIACEGRMIRTLEHARVTHSIVIESSPTLLYIYEEEGSKHVIFGTVDGKIGLLDLDRSHSFKKWLISNPDNSSAVSCLNCYDFTKDGINNLIIGRNDGNIEVYTIHISDPMDQAVLIFSYNCNESVTSLQCGIVGSVGYDEILVSTYTGRIFGLTTETTDKNVGGDSTSGNYIFSVDTTQKIIKLRNEIEELQGSLVKEREKYQSLTYSFMDDFSAIPTLTIKDSLVLSKSGASYTLTLEVPTAIDNVLLQSDVPIDLLDVEKNSAVVSYSEADPKKENYLLATYRCQINTNRLEVKIRTIEGQYGTLQAYVTPLIQPKFCQLRQYSIKPLSLHLRIHHFDENRPYNVLTVKGTFSLAEIHAWISNCLPEVPEKPNPMEDTVLNFQSAFLDTMLQCKYMKGEGIFKSDNVSTISILKEYLSKEATRKNTKFEVNAAINDDSINHVLNMIDPKLNGHIQLANKVALMDALQELEINDEESVGYLTENYRNLLVNKASIRAEFSSQPSYLDRLHGIITDLYIDYYKFKGMNVKAKVPRLLEVLQRYTYTELLHIFRPTYV